MNTIKRQLRGFLKRFLSFETHFDLILCDEGRYLHSEHLRTPHLTKTSSLIICVYVIIFGTQEIVISTGE